MSAGKTNQRPVRPSWEYPDPDVPEAPTTTTSCKSGNLVTTTHYDYDAAKEYADSLNRAGVSTKIG